MSQIISIHIGQAGTQIGTSVWQLFCLQHNIDCKGKNIEEESSVSKESGNIKVFYSETEKGRKVPRSIFIDLQPTVIDQIRTGPQRDLFRQDSLISGKQDAANNCSRGKYTIGRQYIDQVLNQIRIAAQACENLEGFMLYNSICGGTGSGFTQLLFQRMLIQYGNKKQTCNILHYPSPNISNSTVQPYNAVFPFQCTLSRMKTCIMFDNQALYQLASRKLGIQRPNYKNINQIIAQAVSSMTVGCRFPGILNSKLKDISTNLVSYPRAHYLMPSMPSLIAEDQANLVKTLHASELTKNAFDPQSLAIKCNPNIGKYVNCFTQYRGDVLHFQAIKQIQKIRSSQTVKFCEWWLNSNKFKVALNQKPVCSVPNSGIAQTKRSCFMLSNNTSIRKAIESIDKKFYYLYSKRAFYHWYIGEGMDHGQFDESITAMASLQRDLQGMQQNNEASCEQEQ